eukprot:8702387-Alexandrium_andersonii.AAC.1
MAIPSPSSHSSSYARLHHHTGGHSLLCFICAVCPERLIGKRTGMRRTGSQSAEEGAGIRRREHQKEQRPTC